MGVTNGKVYYQSAHPNPIPDPNHIPDPSPDHIPNPIHNLNVPIQPIQQLATPENLWNSSAHHLTYFEIQCKKFGINKAGMPMLLHSTMYCLCP